MIFAPKAMPGSVFVPEGIHELLTNDSVQAVLDCLPMPVFYKSAEGVYLGCNQAFSETLGLAKEQLIGKTSHQLFPKEQADQYCHYDDLLFASGGKQTYEGEITSKGGALRFVRFHKTTFNDKSGRVAGLLGVFEDLTEQKVLEKQLLRLASQDPLTSLYNRRAIEEKLQEELALAEEYNRSTAVIMLDLDGFKQLNDNHGHLAGDLLLKSLSSLMREQLRPTDHLGRYGGDEFIIVLPHTPLEQANLYAERLLLAIRQHDFGISSSGVRLGASLGVAASELPVTMDKLISMADSAMYQAKKSGRNQVAITED